MSDPVNADTVTSHEQDGRVLSGVGVSAEQLAETMERHAPSEPVAQEPPPVTGTSEAPAAPSQTRGQKRFSELTAEREAAKAEAAKERAEREVIAKENAELKARISQPPPQPRREPQSEPTPQPKRETFPTFDEFVELKGNESLKDDPNAWYAYSDARADWRYEQRRQQERAEESSREEARTFQTHVSRYMTELEDARRTIPDIETAIAAVPLGSVSKVIERASIEAGPRATYWLAKHPQERAELTQDTLVHPDDPAFRATVAATRRYLEAVSVEAPKAPAKAAWTPPPSPHPTVGASSPTTPTASAELAAKGDYEAYRQKRAQERGVKLRR